METVIKISDAEWQVMRVIWTKESATAQEISQLLGVSMNWQPATVKTLLGRLVKKEMLQTHQVGKRFVYSPLVSEEATVKSATEELFSHICAKKMGETIAEMIEIVSLTEADLALIEEKIRQKKPVTQIACNCIPGQCECGNHR